MTVATYRATPDRQSGMTLIEVLVTVVLISVGLLGVAALQLVSLKNNQDAYVRSQASSLAGDILDRMRANPVAFRLDQYEVVFNGMGNAGTIAGRDLADWQGSIDRLLPGGAGPAAGQIACTFDPATRSNVVTVTIRWSERADAATGTDAEEPTFQTRSEI